MGAPIVLTQWMTGISGINKLISPGMFMIVDS